MKTIIIGFLLMIATGIMAKSYKGAEIYTTESWKYGKIEMRMRMAKGSGILSTFFTYKTGSELSGAFWEEIDLEVFGKNNATSFQSNIITNNPKKYSEGHHSPGYSMGDGYHTYTLEWTPDYIAWYIDGVEMRKTYGGLVSELTSSQSFRFNIWAANIVEWVGAFDTNALPAYQFVNWIKYSRYTPGSGDNGTDFTLDWTDDFNSFNTSRWSKANWTFGENLTDFDPNNALVRDGYLVLAITREGQTGFTGTVPPDQVSNPTPTVSISSPSANDKFCIGNNITITANASISSGSISKVDFYNGNTLIGTDNTSPYSYTWTNATAGTKTIRAIATSNANVESLAATVDVTVSEPVTITPYIQTNGGSWLQQSTTQLCAGGSVAIGPQPNTQDGWTWTGPDNFTANTREITLNNITIAKSGKYTATYNDGSCISSAEITVTVNDVPPAPSVTTPVVYTQNTTASALVANGTALQWYNSATAVTGTSIAPIPSTSTVGNTSYFVSQTINSCESTRSEIIVTINPAEVIKISLHTGWNLIGYPFEGSAEISSALSSIWNNIISVKDMNSFYLKEQPEFLNTLNTLGWGKGYLINVSVDCELEWMQ